MTVTQYRIWLLYHVTRIRHDLPLWIQYLLHKYLGFYVEYASKYNALHKKTYNDGLPIALEDVRLLCHADDSLEYTFNIPVEKCVWGLGWRYSPKDNPFARFFDHQDILKKFYASYCPSTLEEALTLDIHEPRQPRSASFNNQLNRRIKKINKVARHGISKKEGVQAVGSVSPTFLQLENCRLNYVRASIERHGWQPNKFSGYITGLFLIYKNDYLFVVQSGRHRSAILSYMGYASLPCAFTRMRARMIRIEDHPNCEMYKLFFDDALILKRRKFLDDLCSV